MKALVTGAAGFVGRHLCPKLQKAGYDVVEIDPKIRDCDESHFSFPLEKLFAQQAYRWYNELALLGSYDLVVHLAANIVNVDARMKGGISMYGDIELDLAMCRWLENNPPRRCAVLMSSCAVDYPDDPYCIVKRNLEAFAKTLDKKGVPVIVLRPFSGYGEDQSEEYPFRAILERALRKEDPLTVWGGNQVRDWIHVEDLTDAILFAAQLPRPVWPIEVGTAVGTSLSELAVKIAAEVGYKPSISCDQKKPTSSCYRVARPGAHVQGEATLQDFGWSPKISLDEGIRRAVASRMVNA